MQLVTHVMGRNADMNVLFLRDVHLIPRINATEKHILKCMCCELARFCDS